MGRNGVVRRCHHTGGDPISHVARATQGWRVEHASQQGTHNATDAVYAEHVERVIRPQHFLERTDTPQTGKAGDRTNHQRAADTNVAGSRCDGHQAGHGTRGGTQHGSLAPHQCLAHAPGQYGCRRGAQGVDEGQGGKAVGFECRAGIEAEPTHPQQRGTDHGQRQAVRRHGFLAVADALANHEGTDQACNGGVDVHHRAAGKVQRAGLPDETGFRVHGIDHVFGAVGVGAHPEPNHVRNRGVAEGEPQHHEGDHGRELHAFGKGTNDQAARDASKGGLEGGKHNLGYDHALAEGGCVGKRAGRVVPDAFHEQPVKAAKEASAFGEGQAVAIDEPQHHNQREGHHHLHQHRQHVLGAHQAAIKQGQAGHRHQDHQQGGDHHPGGIALVRHECRGRWRRCGGSGCCSRCSSRIRGGRCRRLGCFGLRRGGSWCRGLRRYSAAEK